jgi:hypothetical protein
LNKDYLYIYNKTLKYITTSKAIKRSLKFVKEGMRNCFDGDQEVLLSKLLKTVKFELVEEIKEKYVMMPDLDESSLMYDQATKEAMLSQEGPWFSRIPIKIIAENIYFSMYYAKNKENLEVITAA